MPHWVVGSECEYVFRGLGRSYDCFMPRNIHPQNAQQRATTNAHFTRRIDHADAEHADSICGRVCICSLFCVSSTTHTRFVQVPQTFIYIYTWYIYFLHKTSHEPLENILIVRRALFNSTWICLNLSFSYLTTMIVKQPHDTAVSWA